MTAHNNCSAESRDEPRRPGPPRLEGMKPTKKFWSAEDEQTVREMRAAGATAAAIGVRFGRSGAAIRSLLAKGKPSLSCGIPLAEREKGLTSKRCRKCEGQKPLSEFAVHTFRGAERRWPYCKPCEIARLADRREKGLHLEKTRRHIAKYRVNYPEKHRANQIFGAAIRSGKIVRPDTCPACGVKPAPNRLGRPTIQGHHDDYSKPLDVKWFCHPCHIQHHRNLKNG